MYDEFITPRSHRKNKIDNILKCNKGLLGGITDAIGLTDYSGAEKAQQQAVAVQEKAAGESLQIARENIAFQREQYNQWNNVFGDLAENINDYYSTTSSSGITAQRIAALNTELKKSEKDLTQSLAQRGISSSGLEAQALTSLNYQGAAQRANIRATAEEETINKKLGFLSLGLGQGSAYAGIVNQASGVGADSALRGGIATSGAYSQYGDITYKQSSETEQNFLDAGVGAMKNPQMVSSAMAMFSDIRLKDKVQLLGTHNGFNVYSWKWNDKAIELGIQTNPTVGYIAQEVKDSRPDAVVEDSSGYLKIDYAKLGGLDG